ncbi:MAG: DUF58 domain-containing protein [Deltaproteobacteria bacterium]|nr:MAG: DUF58 domain-containing protein [Deltaproteobacteria bacterium]
MGWDPAVLARIRHLHLRARVLTESLMMGEHRSRRVGQAVEFADYQEYQPGADLRHLDWKVLARSDRLVIKRFVTETQLPCTVVVDLSGDMDTGTTGRGGYPDLDTSKAGYALTLAATLLFFLHRHGEPVGLELLAGQGAAYTSLPPRTGKNHLQQCFAALATARPGGRANLGQTLLAVGGRTRRRSWVGLITDGMEEPSEWLPAMSAFARRKTDVRLFHLFDRGEWTLDFKDAALFYSPEGGEDLAVDPGGAREAFAEVVDDYVSEVRSGIVRFGGRYVPVGTDVPLEDAIRRAILDGVAEGTWA